MRKPLFGKKKQIKSYKKNQDIDKELRQAKKRIAELEEQLLSKNNTKQSLKNIQKPNLTVQANTDWSKISNEELWLSDKKYRGGSIEKIKRSFDEICEYNRVAHERNWVKLAITNQSLRALSGVNGTIISEWLKENHKRVIKHHQTYGLLNQKNPKLLETYHNKKVDSDYLVRFIGSTMGILNPPDWKYGEKR